MSTERILIHGTTAQRMATTPALGQIGSDDDLGVVVVGDGVTPGGVVMARGDQVLVSPTESVPGNFTVFGDEEGRVAEDSGFRPQSSTLDASAGALLAVGAFGLGANLTMVTGHNLNDDRPSGTYYCSSATNTPTGTASGYLRHMQVSEVYTAQEFIVTGSGVRHFREKVGGAWKAWTDDLPAGSVVNSAIATYSANVDLDSLIPFDATIPQNTEGVQIITLPFTPRSATNKLRARFIGRASSGGAPAGIAWAIFNGIGAGAVAAGHITAQTNNFSYDMGGEVEFVAGSTAARTLSVRVGSTAIFRMNGNMSQAVFGAANFCALVVEEIKV